MKKILLAVVLILVAASGCYGAASDDVYLRRDVFEAKMDAFMAEIRLGNEQIRREMNDRFNVLDRKIDNVKTELH